MPRYADTTDLARFGISREFLDDVPLAEQEAALEAASVLAEGYLGRRYGTPLVAWGADLRRAVAIIAAADLLRVRGYSPDGRDQAMADASAGQIRWLEQVAAGRTGLAGAVDATPGVAEADPVVDSDEPRGW